MKKCPRFRLLHMCITTHGSQNVKLALPLFNMDENRNYPTTLRGSS